MNFEIKNLKLLDSLNFSKNQSDSNILKTEKLFSYVCKVLPNETSPKKEDFLTDEQFLGCGYYGENQEMIDNKIEAGEYFFVQVACSVSDKEKFAEVAESVFLESLWQEVKLSTNIYLRELKEENGCVGQLIWQKL